jgi:hypothetical protein
VKSFDLVDPKRSQRDGEIFDGEFEPAFAVVVVAAIVVVVGEGAAGTGCAAVGMVVAGATGAAAVRTVVGTTGVAGFAAVVSTTIVVSVAGGATAVVAGLVVVTAAGAVAAGAVVEGCAFCVAGGAVGAGVGGGVVATETVGGTVVVGAVVVVSGTITGTIAGTVSGTVVTIDVGGASTSRGDSPPLLATTPITPSTAMPATAVRNPGRRKNADPGTRLRPRSTPAATESKMRERNDSGAAKYGAAMTAPPGCRMTARRFSHAWHSST